LRGNANEASWVRDSNWFHDDLTLCFRKSSKMPNPTEVQRSSLQLHPCTPCGHFYEATLTLAKYTQTLNASMKSLCKCAHKLIKSASIKVHINWFVIICTDLISIQFSSFTNKKAAVRKDSDVSIFIANHLLLQYFITISTKANWRMFTLTLLSLAVAWYTNSHISFKYAASFYRRPALFFIAFKVFLMIGAISSVTKQKKTS